MILQLFLTFARIGAFAFGGGLAMLPLFERELVARQGWLTHPQFLDLVVLSQITPGPVATSAATIAGFRQAGVLGALAATIGVFLPAALIVWFLARLIVHHGCLPWLQAVLKGLRPVVLALLLLAAVTLARTSVPDLPSMLVAVLAVTAVVQFRVHPFAVVLGAGLVGILFLG